MANDDDEPGDSADYSASCDGGGTGDRVPEPLLITATATDACGNSSQQNQTITVEDTEAPVLVGCPNDASYQCLADVPGPANVTATDNCGRVTVSHLDTANRKSGSPGMPRPTV